MAIFSEDDESVMLVAVMFSDGLVGCIEAYSTPDVMDANSGTILTIAGTFDRPDGMTATEDDDAAPDTTAPAQLENYNQDYQAVIAELETAGLVPFGGTRVFAEDYAYFTGQGAWYTPLAHQSPHTNFVMSGVLTFTPSGADEPETCTLGLRVVWEGDTTAAFVDVGLATGNVVYYLDLPLVGESSTATEDGVDLTKPHNFTILALGDALTVYLDGKLVFDNEKIEERAGTWGVGLIGKGAGAQCEGRDIWVYSVPQPGVCEVRAANAVNRRSAPNTNASSPGQLAAGSVARVIGQTKGEDGFVWWQLDDNSWVRDDVITAVGDCATVPETTP